MGAEDVELLYSQAMITINPMKPANAKNNARPAMNTKMLQNMQNPSALTSPF